MTCARASEPWNEASDMATCRNHPDRETKLLCAKNGYYLCEECAECLSPEMHCQHRTACPIWFMRKQKKKVAESAS